MVYTVVLIVGDININLGVGTLTLTFIILKLCGVIAWSWWWVLSPTIFGLLLIGLIFLIVWWFS